MPLPTRYNVGQNIDRSKSWPRGGVREDRPDGSRCNCRYLIIGDARDEGLLACGSVRSVRVR